MNGLDGAGRGREEGLPPLQSRLVASSGLSLHASPGAASEGSGPMYLICLIQTSTYPAFPLGSRL